MSAQELGEQPQPAEGAHRSCARGGRRLRDRREGHVRGAAEEPTRESKRGQVDKDALVLVQLQHLGSIFASLPSLCLSSPLQSIFPLLFLSV